MHSSDALLMLALFVGVLGFGYAFFAVILGYPLDGNGSAYQCWYCKTWNPSTRTHCVACRRALR